MTLKACLRQLCCAAVLVSVTPAFVHACSCVMGVSISRDGKIKVLSVSKQTTLQFKQSDVVFIGSVENVEATKFRREDGTVTDLDEYSVRLSVKTLFKGKLQDTVVSENGTGAGDCSWGKMQVGREYLIYGYQQNRDVISIALCSGTHMIRDASESASDPALANDQKLELQTLLKLSRKKP